MSNATTKKSRGPEKYVFGVFQACVFTGEYGASPTLKFYTVLDLRGECLTSIQLLLRILKNF